MAAIWPSWDSSDDVVWYTVSASNDPSPEPEYDPPPLPPWECVVYPEQKISRGNTRDARPAIWACRPRHGLGG
jgi:hypothetical protein